MSLGGCVRTMAAGRFRPGHGYRRPIERRRCARAWWVAAIQLLPLASGPEILWSLSRRWSQRLSDIGVGRKHTPKGRRLCRQHRLSQRYWGGLACDSPGARWVAHADIDGAVGTSDDNVISVDRFDGGSLNLVANSVTGRHEVLEICTRTWSIDHDTMQ